MVRLKTIILKFSGPLQSWGTNSHFETRHTDSYPSKSAVIGLIAAALGYRRDENEKIKKLNQLDFGVRIDQPGQLLSDYHTARSFNNKGNLDRTYVTNRYYLEDAIFLVAIGHCDDDWIDEILGGLRSPYFQMCMGRRSLPVPMDFIFKITEDDVIHSLKNTDWQASSWYRKRQNKYLDAYADKNLVNSGRVSLRKDYVESFDQKSREFSYREESHFMIHIPSERNKTEHDAFSALKGGQDVSITSRNR